MLTFKTNDTEVSTSNYQMATFEVVYDRVKKEYIKRFSCQTETNKSKNVIDFLNSNLDSFIGIVHNDFSLLDARVVFVNADIVTNICRIEIQQGLE